MKGLTEWRASWRPRAFATRRATRLPTWRFGSGFTRPPTSRRVSVRWVRGHTGDRCNEKADALANKALALKTRSDA